MVSIYDFLNYSEYLNAWIGRQSNGGRGLKSQFAKVLGVSSTLVSFLLSGKKNLSLEQASDLADFIGLSEAESDYLFLLVEFERAGHHRLKEKLQKKISQLRNESKKISGRLKKDVQLTDEEKAVYYSSWVYTGIRNLVAAEPLKDASAIAKRLHLPLATVQRALQFLLEHQLCIAEKGGLKTGPTYTHLDASSPLVTKHHQNWRLRGFTMMEQKSEADLFYSCPMSISQADAERIRAMLLNYVQEIVQVMRPSPSETVRCLNIDFFAF